MYINCDLCEVRFVLMDCQHVLWFYGQVGMCVNYPTRGWCNGVHCKSKDTVSFGRGEWGCSRDYA